MRGFNSRLAAVAAISVIAGLIVGAAIVSPALLRQTTVEETSTATSTSISTSTLVSTATSTATTTSTQTTTATLTLANSSQTYGTPISVITHANITVGMFNPSFMSVAAYAAGLDGDWLYVSGPSGVTVINADTEKVYANIPIAGGTSDVAVNTSTGTIYTNSDLCQFNCTQSIYVINFGWTSISTISLGKQIGGIAVNYLTNMVYAIAVGSNSLFVINGTTNRLVANVTLPVPTEVSGGVPIMMARQVVVNQFTNMIYVSASGLDLAGLPTLVYAVNGTSNSIVAQIPLKDNPEPDAMAVNPFSRMVYVSADNELISINGSTYAETVENVSILPVSCNGILVDFSGDIYLSCSPTPDNPSFIILNANGDIINSFTDEGSPAGLAIEADTPISQIFLVNEQGYVLSLLYSFQLPP